MTTAGQQQIKTGNNGGVDELRSDAVRCGRLWDAHQNEILYDCTKYIIIVIVCAIKRDADAPAMRRLRNESHH